MLNLVIDFETAKKLKDLKQESLFYWYKGSMSSFKEQIIDARVAIANMRTFKQEIGTEIYSAFMVEEMNSFIPKQFGLSYPEYLNEEFVGWATEELLLEDDYKQEGVKTSGRTETEAKGKLLVLLLEKDLI